MAFTTHWISPDIPTTLGSREWLPLPPTEHNFYPMVNTWTTPKPLDVSRLKAALAKALQIYPLNSARLVPSKRHEDWRLDLVNRAIPLTIGTSPKAGIFDPEWKGEKDPDYYDELPRFGASLDQYQHLVLTKIKVTTYQKTGETSIMVSQSYNLGDGFAFAGFMTAWSDFYQGKQAAYTPTFEKYLLPEPFVKPSASHNDAISGISWLAAGYDDEHHYQRTAEMEISTSRVDFTFDAAHVDEIFRYAKKNNQTGRLSRGDALAGYVVDVLQSISEDPPRLIQQCVGFRGQKISINGSEHYLPLTTLGMCYIVYTTDLGEESSATGIANALQLSRLELADPKHLGKVHAMYTHLYKKANLLGSLPIDSGHQDAIAFNNCIKLDLRSPHFGYPKEATFIEWEVLENFVQIMHANPIRLANGSYKQNPGALSIVTKLRDDLIPAFLQRLEEDRALSSRPGSSKL